ncbi:MAG: UTP--glucose-1-phosphate uridylyltransferase [Actinomycetota bacterium]
MQIKKAVIPAAGRGTRLERITLVNAKELIPLVDRPAIDWIVKEASEAGIEEICIVTSVNKVAALFAHTQDLPIEVTYLIQDEPRGLGHAVQVARNWCGDDSFALMLPDDLVMDDPILNRLVEHVSKTGNSALALTEVPKEKAHLYGVAAGNAVDGVVEISDLIEKPAPGTEPSNLVVTGRYVLNPEVWPLLEKVKPGAGGEIQLTDALRELAHAGRLSGLVTSGMRHDLGSAESWLKANIAFGVGVYGSAWLDELHGEIKKSAK